MASYVLIELDTVSPNVEIYAPRYTTREINNEIIVSADESVSNYQEIYIIDSSGIRHDYTFEKTSTNELTGIVRLELFPLGLATIYARLKDEVDNFSEVVSKVIEIKESLNKVSISVTDSKYVNVSIKDNKYMKVIASDTDKG